MTFQGKLVIRLLWKELAEIGRAVITMPEIPGVKVKKAVMRVNHTPPPSLIWESELSNQNGRLVWEEDLVDLFNRHLADQLAPWNIRAVEVEVVNERGDFVVCDVTFRDISKTY